MTSAELKATYAHGADGAEPYVPKTAMRWYQARDFERFADQKEVALIYEQRCGKSKVILDLAARHFLAGRIDALLVFALPSGVPANWCLDEVPAHLPDSVPRRCLVWSAGRAGTKAYQAELKDMLSYRGLAVLAVNGEAVHTKALRAFLPKFLAKRRVFAVGDESTLLMKSPGAVRSKLLHAVARRYPNVLYRAILDGTVHGESPLDYYSQFEFLRPAFFGYSNFFTFKHRYAEWTKETNWSTGREYEAIKVDEVTKEKTFINLGELHAKVSRVAARVTRAEAWPSYAPPVFQKRRFALTDEQRRVYDGLAEECEAELGSLGKVQARHVLTRYLRLQQVASNFWPPSPTATPCATCADFDSPDPVASPREDCPACDGTGYEVGSTPLALVDPASNPRRDALRDELRASPVPTLVWTRFRYDAEQALAVAAEEGRRAVRYDGTVGAEGKLEALRAFQEGRADLMAVNAQSAGRGLKLLRLAKGADGRRAQHLHVFYSNYFGLLARLQAQDRTEDAENGFPTQVVDLVAEGTIDEVIISALREKRSLADVVMRERSGRWL